jgi:hypothetical protein
MLTELSRLISLIRFKPKEKIFCQKCSDELTYLGGDIIVETGTVYCCNISHPITPCLQKARTIYTANTNKQPNVECFSSRSLQKALEGKVLLHYRKIAKGSD